MNHDRLNVRLDGTFILKDIDAQAVAFVLLVSFPSIIFQSIGCLRHLAADRYS